MMRYIEAVITTEGALFAQKERDTATVLSVRPDEARFYREAVAQTEAVTLQWQNAGPLRVEWVPDGANALVNMMLLEERQPPMPLLVALLLGGTQTPSSAAVNEFRDWQREYADTAKRSFSRELPEVLAALPQNAPTLVTLSAYWNFQEQPEAFYRNERYLSASANLFAAAFFESNPALPPTSK